MTRGPRIVNRDKDSLFKNQYWRNWIITFKIISKWINDLNVRPDTIKLLDENIGRTLCDVNHSKIFFNPLLRVMKIKINK